MFHKETRNMPGKAHTQELYFNNIVSVIVFVKTCYEMFLHRQNIANYLTFLDRLKNFPKKVFHM